ncbi:MAG: 4-oxalocrotonate tautomerase family protein [Planctomycetota bacterium]
MPYINLKITDDGVTSEQKARIIREFTDTLTKVLGKHPDHIHIVIDEIPEQNWGYAGLLTDEYRRRSAKPDE